MGGDEGRRRRPSRPSQEGHGEGDEGHEGEEGGRPEGNESEEGDEGDEGQEEVSFPGMMCAAGRANAVVMRYGIWSDERLSGCSRLPLVHAACERIRPAVVLTVLA